MVTGYRRNVRRFMTKVEWWVSGEQNIFILPLSFSLSHSRIRTWNLGQCSLGKKWKTWIRLSLVNKNRDDIWTNPREHPFNPIRDLCNRPLGECLQSYKNRLRCLLLLYVLLTGAIIWLNVKLKSRFMYKHLLAGSRVKSSRRMFSAI